MTDVFRGFPQYLQANTGIVPETVHECFLPHPYPFTLFIIILLFLIRHCITSVVDTGSLNTNSYGFTVQR